MAPELLLSVLDRVLDEVTVRAAALAAGIWAFYYLHKEIRNIEKRINRNEWDWNELKRIQPELVKDFPPRDGAG